MTANEIIRWFKKRRHITFDKVEIAQNKILIRIGDNIPKSDPPLNVRIYRPQLKESVEKFCNSNIEEYLDIQLTKPVFEIEL